MPNSAQPKTDRFLKAANRIRRYGLPDNLAQALEILGGDPEFTHIKPGDILQAYKKMPRTTLSDGSPIAGQGIADFIRGMLRNKLGTRNSVGTTLDNLLAGAPSIPDGAYKGETPVRSHTTSTHNSHSTTKPTSTIERITAQWEGLATQDKVGIGMSYICAAMAMVGAASRFAHAVDKDAEGKKHFNLSNVMFGTVSAALAAGMAYLGHTQFKAALR